MNTFIVDTERAWKICKKCHKQQNLSEFLIDTRFNLYYSKCKTCEKIKRNKNRLNQRKKDIHFKVLDCLRARVKKVLNGKSKFAPTLKLLGCSLEELKIYLAKKFQEGMSWDNHGYGETKWHIDHIRPCASFDLSKPEEQVKCFHYSNLQPLWQKDNLQKSDKLL